MCIKGCLGFTSPYTDLEQCLDYRQPHYQERELEESDGERKVP